MSELLIDSTDDGFSTTSKDNVQSGFGSYLSRFEAEATTLERGFRTALFIQQFKAGLLPQSERGTQRLQ